MIAARIASRAAGGGGPPLTTMLALPLATVARPPVPKLMVEPEVLLQRRFVPFTLRVDSVTLPLTVLTVMAPMEDTVPIVLAVTLTALPLPAAPGCTIVTFTLAPDCEAVSPGAETKPLIAVVIWPASALVVEPAPKLIGAEVTCTPLMVIVSVPPAAFTVDTWMLPSFCTASHKDGVAVQLMDVVTPRCLAKR